MAITWWMWLIAGSALLVLEIITPGGFYVLFFGIGAIVVGLLAALGLAGPPWMQWLLFAAISILALAFFRRPLLRKFNTPTDHKVDSMVGEEAIAMETIGAAAIGKAELRGSVWSARNAGDRIITPGQRCRVERIEGLMLHLKG
jgi:inner membrane protein